MRSISAFAAPVAFIALIAAAATPALAQNPRFGIEAPRSEPSSGYYYQQSPHKDVSATDAQKPFQGLGPYSHPLQRTPGTDGAEDCYTRSLGGRICID